jgi:hypothetical protein
MVLGPGVFSENVELCGAGCLQELGKPPFRAW